MKEPGANKRDRLMRHETIDKKEINTDDGLPTTSIFAGRLRAQFGRTQIPIIFRLALALGVLVTQLGAVTRCRYKFVYALVIGCPFALSVAPTFTIPVAIFVDWAIGASGGGVTSTIHVSGSYVEE